MDHEPDPVHRDSGGTDPWLPNQGMGFKLKRLLFGNPKDPLDHSVFHKISLIPVLAWIGLGADGLSSAAYGPEEAFRALGSHTYLCLGLALMTILTIVIISSAYSRIIEQFPHGGGGYVVATKLLGNQAGVVSGCALLVDYVLTITVSIAAAGDAIFSFLPLSWLGAKLGFEIAMILFLTVINIRGVKESVLFLAPIFVLFIVTHTIGIFYGIFMHTGDFHSTAVQLTDHFHSGLSSLGGVGLMLLFLHSYSLGGGTYTGLEAVSNGLPIMRDPKVKTAQRTMIYMAVSLAFMAGGLLVCYLFWHVAPEPGKTLNAVLFERMTADFPMAVYIVVVTLFSEGALLIVGAQAGFIDGPRVLANMAIDYWMPTNGIALMGLAAVAALVYASGNVSHLVVMYSINVFLTFSLSMLAMALYWFKARKRKNHWRGPLAHFCIGFVFCVTILCITTFEKFTEGGWITIMVTTVLIALCFLIRSHYRGIASYLMQMPARWDAYPKIKIRAAKERNHDDSRVAAVLVGGFGGFGVHMLHSILENFPGQFSRFVLMSVGVVDSGGFKGEEEMKDLQDKTTQTVQKYVELMRELGFEAEGLIGMGTDVVTEAEKLCLQAAGQWPHITFFAGKVVFQTEGWFHRILHNETAFSLQRRLTAIARTLVVMPIKIA